MFLRWFNEIAGTAPNDNPTMFIVRLGTLACSLFTQDDIYPPSPWDRRAYYIIETPVDISHGHKTQPNTGLLVNSRLEAKFVCQSWNNISMKVTQC